MTETRSEQLLYDFVCLTYVAYWHAWPCTMDPKTLPVKKHALHSKQFHLA